MQDYAYGVGCDAQLVSNLLIAPRPQLVQTKYLGLPLRELPNRIAQCAGKFRSLGVTYGVASGSLGLRQIAGFLPSSASHLLADPIDRLAGR
jgi:hypothetical protein